MKSEGIKIVSRCFLFLRSLDIKWDKLETVLEIIPFHIRSSMGHWSP